MIWNSTSPHNGEINKAAIRKCHFASSPLAESNLIGDCIGGAVDKALLLHHIMQVKLEQSFVRIIRMKYILDDIIPFSRIYNRRCSYAKNDLEWYMVIHCKNAHKQKVFKTVVASKMLKTSVILSIEL